MTYTVDTVDERIVAAVAHGQPMTAKKYDVDIMIPKYIKIS